MNVSRFINSLIVLVRPVNLMITAMSVWVGGIIAGGREFALDETLLLASLAAALVAAGGNTINDVCDTVIDMANRPERPIPSGHINSTGATIWAVVLSLAGVTIGFQLSQTLGILTISVAVLLWVYSYWFKETILLGNIIVAVCGSMAFMYGAIAVNNPKMGMYPALFAALIHLGREIVKDVEDVFGDRLWGAMTFPVVAGPESAQKIAGLILATLVVTTFIPYKLGIFGQNYLLIIILLVNIPILVIVFMLFRGLKRKGLQRASDALKLIMIAGLVALYVG
ncbi:geranylgeranylglycerol-phosphate geranylgeranyltransferase [bacterium]|nr:geranylgeranylglycerol-phosphate geranylgeranyltransferase [bacterium]